MLPPVLCAYWRSATHYNGGCWARGCTLDARACARACALHASDIQCSLRRRIATAVERIYWVGMAAAARGFHVSQDPSSERTKPCGLIGPYTLFRRGPLSSSRRSGWRSVAQPRLLFFPPKDQSLFRLRLASTAVSDTRFGRVCAGATPGQHLPSPINGCRSLGCGGGPLCVRGQRWETCINTQCVSLAKAIC